MLILEKVFLLSREYEFTGTRSSLNVPFTSAPADKIDIVVS